MEKCNSENRAIYFNCTKKFAMYISLIGMWYVKYVVMMNNGLIDYWERKFPAITWSGLLVHRVIMKLQWFSQNSVDLIFNATDSTTFEMGPNWTFVEHSMGFRVDRLYSKP